MRGMIFVALALLTACGGTVTSCPPIKDYSRSFQTRLADELGALPDGRALGQAMVDYKSLRDQIRACRGE